MKTFVYLISSKPRVVHSKSLPPAFPRLSLSFPLTLASHIQYKLLPQRSHYFPFCHLRGCAPNAPQLKRFCRSTNPEFILCRHPARAENYILLFIIPTLTHGDTACRPLRGLNIKRWFSLFYYSLRRRCNNVAQRRKPWECKDYIKDNKPPQGGDT